MKYKYFIIGCNCCTQLHFRATICAKHNVFYEYSLLKNSFLKKISSNFVRNKV